MTDNSYNKRQIKIRPGETVRFMLVNNGESLHEFNIGSPGDHHEHQKEMLRMMEMGMLSPGGRGAAKKNEPRSGMGHEAMQHDDPNSILVYPGETGELIWKFGDDSTLEFACNIPGHYQAGMVGRFRFDR